MSKLFDDARHALRVLAKSPGITLIAVTTLALGIGANTAIFSVADGLLWKPVPLPDSGRLAMVMDQYRQDPGWVPISPGNYRDWKQQSHVFDHLAVYEFASVNLTAAGA